MGQTSKKIYFKGVSPFGLREKYMQDVIHNFIDITIAP